MSENQPYTKDGVLNVIETQVNLLTGKENKLARGKLGHYVKSWAETEGMPVDMAYGRLIKGLFRVVPKQIIMDNDQKEKKVTVKSLAEKIADEKAVWRLDYSDPKALTVGRILQTAKEQGVALNPDFLGEVMQGLVEVPAHKCKDEVKSNFLVHYLGEMVETYYGNHFDKGREYENMLDKCRVLMLESRAGCVRDNMTREMEKVIKNAHPSRLAGLQNGQNKRLIRLAKKAHVAEEGMVKVHS